MKKYSLRNFRDLSYLGKIKPKHLIRSSVLFNLNNSAINTIKSLNLDEIIDLRSIEEINKKPDTKFNNIVNVAFKNSKTVNIDDGIDRYSISRYLNNKRCDKKYRDDEFEFYRKIYTDNIYNNDAIKEIFKLMKEHKKFLFHCHGGKDRTGICALLILASLGFSKNDIVKDYLKTNNKFYFYLTKYGLRLLGFNSNGIDIVMFNSFAIKELIESTFEEIENKYQTIENFLLKEYCITSQMIIDFKNYYLNKVTDC